MVRAYTTGTIHELAQHADKLLRLYPPDEALRERDTFICMAVVMMCVRMLGVSGLAARASDLAGLGRALAPTGTSTDTPTGLPEAWHTPLDPSACATSDDDRLTLASLLAAWCKRLVLDHDASTASALSSPAQWAPVVGCLAARVLLSPPGRAAAAPLATPWPSPGDYVAGHARASLVTRHSDCIRVFARIAGRRGIAPAPSHPALERTLAYCALVSGDGRSALAALLRAQLPDGQQILLQICVSPPATAAVSRSPDSDCADSDGDPFLPWSCARVLDAMIRLLLQGAPQGACELAQAWGAHPARQRTPSEPPGGLSLAAQSAWRTALGPVPLDGPAGTGSAAGAACPVPRIVQFLSRIAQCLTRTSPSAVLAVLLAAREVPVFLGPARLTVLLRLVLLVLFPARTETVSCTVSHSAAQRISAVPAPVQAWAHQHLVRLLDEPVGSWAEVTPPIAPWPPTHDRAPATSLRVSLLGIETRLARTAARYMPAAPATQDTLDLDALD